MAMHQAASGTEAIVHTTGRQLTLPPGLDWELVVVNNNSPDDTDRVIAAHTGQLPIVRVFEGKQGHCHARNAAVAAARGDFLVWTDDDVLVPPDWLTHYLDAAARHPEAAVFGGPVRPWFAVTPPAGSPTTWRGWAPAGRWWITGRTCGR